MRVGHETDPAREAERLAAIRAAVGPDVKILADATESWDAERALRTGRLLSDLHWLEDPVRGADFAGMARLRAQLDTPIATGEHLYTLDDFRRLFDEQAVSIAIIDLGRIGGITPWRRVAALAHAHRIPVCGHVLPEVHIHLLAAVPNGHLCEYVPRTAAILTSMPRLEDGALVAPQRPGLGTELDLEALGRYTA